MKHLTLLKPSYDVALLKQGLLFKCKFPVMGDLHHTARSVLKRASQRFDLQRRNVFIAINQIIYKVIFKRGSQEFELIPT